MSTEALERVLARVADRQAHTAAASPFPPKKKPPESKGDSPFAPKKPPFPLPGEAPAVDEAPGDAPPDAPIAPEEGPAPAPPGAPMPPPAPPAPPPPPSSQDPRVAEVLVRLDEVERGLRDMKTEWDAEKQREVEESMADMDKWGDPDGEDKPPGVAIPQPFAASVAERHAAELAALDEMAFPALAAMPDFIQGSDGKFQGSNPSKGLKGEGEGTRKAHREGEPHGEGRVHRALADGIEAMKNSSVTSRSWEISDRDGNDRQMTLSDVKETNRPDTPKSEIVPTIMQAADNPEGAQLDRPIVINGWQAEVKVGPAARPAEPESDKEPGIRNSMMAAARATG
jgi:hypothetical protein